MGKEIEEGKRRDGALAGERKEMPANTLSEKPRNFFEREKTEERTWTSHKEREEI